MSRVAIRVDGLGKRYRIGTAERRHDSLRDLLVAAAKAPLRNLRQLRALSRFGAEDAPDAVWSLRNVGFEVSHGEVLGIVGRNGAGKSTLLKILSRVTSPTTGRVEIHGRVGALLEVGTGFHPELTGRENIYLNGAILGMDRGYIERHFEEIVEFAGVGGFIDTPVKRYSSGMYLRLAFAVAAHLEPEILVVDEILAVGDAEFQKKCLGKMGQVAREGRTVLLVSHNMSSIANLCTRALCLKRGELTANGSVDAVIEHYLETGHSGMLLGEIPDRDRIGRGNVRFTAVHFEDAAGNVVEGGISGETLVIVMHYESRVEKYLRNCRASVAVYDRTGQLLFNLSSELPSHDVLNLPPHGRIRCVIPRLPLSGSQYRIELFLEVEYEIEDLVESPTALSVTDGDYYGTGRLYPPGWQGKGVLLEHSWAAEGADSLVHSAPVP